MDLVLQVASDRDESADEVHGGCFYLVQFDDKLVPEEPFIKMKEILKAK